MVNYTRPEYFALAIIFTIISTLLMALQQFIGYHILTNMRVVMFRSLGRPYVGSLLAITTLGYVMNLVATWMVAMEHNEQLLIPVVGTMTALRSWLIGMLIAVLCGRQFMLGRIFGTLGSKSRYQTFWPPVILATVTWIPLLVVFFLSLFISVDVLYFAVLMLVFYFLYIVLFVYLAYRNRGITRIFSDYSRNMIVFGILILSLAVGIWLITQFQLLTTDNYRFEAGFTFIPGILFPCAFLVVLLPPYRMWITDPEGTKAWVEFNGRNAHLYGKDNSSAIVSDSGLETAISNMQDLAGKKGTVSEIEVV